jgi:hypothetical protein
MHPRTFLDAYWRNDLRDEVFVAMSFDSRYDQRWQEIFAPAIEAEPFGGRSLRAVRVDIRQSGDSILSEIVDGIAHAQLILADVSVTDRWKEGTEGRFARNGNVLYEVGLAAAVRQPVELALVRDDSDRLLFDIGHIPVLRFDPTEVSTSVARIRELLQDRWRERDLTRDLRVTATLEALSQFEVNVIATNAHLTVFSWTGSSLPPAVALALPTLLERRILRLVKPGTGAAANAYTWTTFGRAIADLVGGTRPPGADVAPA